MLKVLEGSIALHKESQDNIVESVMTSGYYWLNAQC